jgi:hypothetical protein
MGLGTDATWPVGLQLHPDTSPRGRHGEERKRKKIRIHFSSTAVDSPEVLPAGLWTGWLTGWPVCLLACLPILTSPRSIVLCNLLPDMCTKEGENLPFGPRKLLSECRHPRGAQTEEACQSFQAWPLEEDTHSEYDAILPQPRQACSSDRDEELLNLVIINEGDKERETVKPIREQGAARPPLTLGHSKPAPKTGSASPFSSLRC